MEKSEKIIIGVLAVAAVAVAAWFFTRPRDAQLPVQTFDDRATVNGDTSTPAGAAIGLIDSITRNGLQVATTVMNENRIAQDRARAQAQADAAAAAAQRTQTGAYRGGGGIGGLFGESKPANRGSTTK